MVRFEHHIVLFFYAQIRAECLIFLGLQSVIGTDRQYKRLEATRQVIDVSVRCSAQ